ncbi:hypothetical protein [Dactylosporangium sp. NPDC051541]|uniref:DUF7691 family protein n=1 Tax=Dactylosporangium sp. NPDC051541 TaxID=3363977 RepID=UPI0037A5830E
MSYSIMPYKIRLSALNDVLATHDEALATWAQTRCQTELAELDDYFEPSRPAAEYLADLMLGRPYVQSDAHLYGYSLKALCNLWGAPMANEGWWGMRYAWFEDVTQAAAQSGAAYDFTDLITGGPGVNIPAGDDFPSMGHIVHDHLQSHLNRLNATDPSRLTDAQAATAVNQVRSWLQECQRDDMDLVCFYH